MKFLSVYSEQVQHIFITVHFITFTLHPIDRRDYNAPFFILRERAGANYRFSSVSSVWGFVVLWLIYLRSVAGVSFHVDIFSVLFPWLKRRAQRDTLAIAPSSVLAGVAATATGRKMLLICSLVFGWSLEENKRVYVKPESAEQPNGFSAHEPVSRTTQNQTRKESHVGVFLFFFS